MKISNKLAGIAIEEKIESFPTDHSWREDLSYLSNRPGLICSDLKPGAKASMTKLFLCIKTRWLQEVIKQICIHCLPGMVWLLDTDYTNFPASGLLWQRKFF